MTLDIKGIDDVIGSFDLFVRKNRQATSRAMNSKLTTARNDAVRNTRATWKGILSADLKRQTKLKKANVKDLSIQFTLKSSPIDLSQFKAKQNKSGVAYKLKGRQRTMKGAFVAKKHVYKRTTDKRLPLRRFVAITPTSMFEGTKSDELFVTNFMKEFEARYKQQIAHLTKIKL